MGGSLSGYIHQRGDWFSKIEHLRVYFSQRLLVLLVSSAGTSVCILVTENTTVVCLNLNGSIHTTLVGIQGLSWGGGLRGVHTTISGDARP